MTTYAPGTRIRIRQNSGTPNGLPAHQGDGVVVAKLPCPTCYRETRNTTRAVTLNTLRTAGETCLNPIGRLAATDSGELVPVLDAYPCTAANAPRSGARDHAHT